MGRGRGRKIDFEELAHVIVEAGKSEICRVGWQAGDPGKVDAAAWVQRLSGVRISSPLGDLSLFLKTFNWLDEAHPHYGGQSALLKVYWLKW